MTVEIPEAFRKYEALGQVVTLDATQVVAFVEADGGGTMTRNGRHALIVTHKTADDKMDNYIFVFPEDPELVELFVQGICQHWPALARYALLDADE